MKIKLTRNLRRSILRGHPWVYKEAHAAVNGVKKAELSQVLDQKGELAWALYDPHSPLSLRILSLEKSKPSKALFESRFKQAFELRSGVRSVETTAYRLWNGEGDFLPGLVCDVYDQVAVIQYDGQGPSEFWPELGGPSWISDWILKNANCKSVVLKSRRKEEKNLELLGGKIFENDVIVKENGVLFKVDLEKGQKTGFFLDQRDNRNYLRQMTAGQTVLNLFSYTGGFSVYAGLGKARKVVSVDIAKNAIALSEENWRLNHLKAMDHFGFGVDVFDFLKNDRELWDQIIVDPPSMSHAKNQKDVAKAKYIELFAAAMKKVNPHGQIFLSSCSSHIHFDDFFEIISEALSLSRRRGQILRISGQGSDHPFPHACFELRYLKFAHLNLD